MERGWDRMALEAEDMDNGSNNVENSMVECCQRDDDDANKLGLTGY